MTAEPDSIAQLLAELRSPGGASHSECLWYADRLEKLSAASVQVTDEDFQRWFVERYGNEFGARAIRAAVKAGWDAALRLSPQGEDHGR